MFVKGQNLVLSFFNIQWVLQNDLMGRYFYLYQNLSNISDLEKEELSILIDGTETEYFNFLKDNNLTVEELKKNPY